MPIRISLKNEAIRIMDTTWQEARGQLLFSLISCICIQANYFFYAFFKNLYHHLQGTPNYVYILRMYCNNNKKTRFLFVLKDDIN